jgi:hypothetical protein
METIIVIMFLFVGFVGTSLGLGLGLFFGAVGAISKEEDAYRRGWEAGFRKGKATPAPKRSEVK